VARLRSEFVASAGGSSLLVRTRGKVTLSERVHVENLFLKFGEKTYKVKYSWKSDDLSFFKLTTDSNPITS